MTWYALRSTLILPYLYHGFISFSPFCRWIRACKRAAGKDENAEWNHRAGHVCSRDVANDYSDRKTCRILRLAIAKLQAPNPNVDLELDEIDLEECIGRGGHGAVYKVGRLIASRQAAAGGALIAGAARPLATAAW